MLSPWLLLSLTFVVSWTFAISRHLTEWQENPTCEQLQEYWRIMSQAARMGAATNTIPVLPINNQIRIGPTRKFIKPHTNIEQESLLNRVDFSEVPWIVQPPILSPNSILLPQPKYSAGEEEIGIFGDFHEQADDKPKDYQNTESQAPRSSSVLLGDRRNIESDFYIPQWGSPEEVDSFGRFVDFDLGPPHFTLLRKSNDVQGTRSGLPNGTKNQKLLEKCDDVLNSDCMVNEHCDCKGQKKLQCVDRRCLHYGTEGKYGVWHNGPLHQSQLRLVAIPRKKRQRSVFM